MHTHICSSRFGEAMWVILALVTSLTTPQAFSTNFELVILHTGNMESQFVAIDNHNIACFNSSGCAGGAAKAMQIVVDERAKDASNPNRKTLYLFSGNMFRGSIWYTVGAEEICAEFINLMKPDAVVLGYSDFTESLDVVNSYMGKLKVPVVLSNVEVPHPSGPRPAYVSHVELTAGTHRIAIVGYIGRPLYGGMLPDDIVTEDVVFALRDLCAKLVKKGFTIFVALGSANFETDLAVAREVPEVDVVVGSSNTVLYNGRSPDGNRVDGPYPTVVRQDSGKPVPVVNLKRRGRFLGRIILTINKNDFVIGSHGQPIFLENKWSSHPQAVALVQKWDEKVRALRNQIVGQTPVYLEGDFHQCCLKECNFGNLITDAIVQHVTANNSDVTRRWTSAAVAMFSCGLLANNIDTSATGGNITHGSLMDAAIFNEDILTCPVTGAALKKMLEATVTDPFIEKKFGYFMQVSGMQVLYDFSRPKYSRVISLQVRCCVCPVPKYELVDATTTYQILAPAELINSNARFPSLWHCESEKTSVGKSNDILLEHLRLHSPVFPEENERIKVLNGGKSKGNDSTSQPSSENIYIYTIVTVFINILYY